MAKITDNATQTRNMSVESTLNLNEASYSELIELRNYLEHIQTERLNIGKDLNSAVSAMLPAVYSEILYRSINDTAPKKSRPQRPEEDIFGHD